MGLQCCSINHEIGVNGKPVNGPVPLYYFAWQGENPLCNQDRYALPVKRLQSKHIVGYTVRPDRREAYERAFERAYLNDEPLPGIPKENRSYVESPALSDTLLVDDEGFPLFDSGAGLKRCLNGLPKPVFKVPNF